MLNAEQIAGRSNRSLWKTAVWLAVLAAAPVISALEITGLATSDYAHTSYDSTANAVLDQSYIAWLSGDAAPAVQYSMSLRYRRVETYLRQGRMSWATEYSPVAEATWSGPFFRLRGEYDHRDYVVRESESHTLGRTGMADFSTIWSRYPRLNVHWLRTENTSDLNQIGLGIRQQDWSGGVDHSWKRLNLHYDFTDRETRSGAAGLDVVSRRHTGRLDGGRDLMSKLLTVRGSYLITARSESENRSTEGPVLISISPQAALYAIDPDPNYGSLESISGLIDNDIDSVTVPAINLLSNEYHNLGLDFGAPVTLDHFYVFLQSDSLIAPAIRWGVFVSEDNLIWTLAEGYAAYPFSPELRGYDIGISPVSSRYVKLVSEPSRGDVPLYVTELRALVVKGEGERLPTWLADQQGSMHMDIRPAKWFSASFGGTANRVDRSVLGLGRNQDGISASFRFVPTRLADFSGQYRASHTEYSSTTGGRNTNEMLSCALRSSWTRQLRSVTTLSQSRETQSGHLNRVADAASIQIAADWTQGISGTTSAGLNEDHRFGHADVLKTRYIGQNVDLQPCPRISASVDYRIYALEAQQASVPESRETSSLRASWSMTRTVTVSGSAGFHRESEMKSSNWQTNANWSATPKLSLGTTLDQTIPNGQPRSTRLSAQTYYRWTMRTDISFSYSVFDIARSASEDFSSLRVGVNTRL